MVWDRMVLVVFKDQIGFLPCKCIERHTATWEEAEMLVVSCSEDL